jgi:hypothetical protein
MYQEYRDLLSAFHAHGVKYLIVGGYAVIFHAQPRFTRDIDLFIKADPANAHATYAALAAFGAPLQGIRPEDFAERVVSFVLETIRTGSIFSPTFRASILRRRGNGISGARHPAELKVYRQAKCLVTSRAKSSAKASASDSWTNTFSPGILYKMF